MDEMRLKAIEALLDHDVVWSETTVEELVAEVRRLREENRGLRVLRPIDYGSEERHDRPRPFAHQHYHAHYGEPKPEGVVPHHTGDFSHPHRHDRDADHHR